MQGSFVGGGLGVGLQTPGADPGWGDWVEFETEDVGTFKDFDGTAARLTTAGAGIALIGYTLAWISFPMRGANSIYVGGFNMGALGADVGTNAGTWNVHGTPPKPVCIPERTETRYSVREENVPYEYDMHNGIRHNAYFARGSATLGDEELARLQAFVDELMQLYIPPVDQPAAGP